MYNSEIIILKCYNMKYDNYYNKYNTIIVHNYTLY